MAKKTNLLKIQVVLNKCQMDILTMSLTANGIKFIFAFLIIAIILSELTSCAQGLKGNGNVLMQERTIASFTHLSVNGTFNLFINQGDEEAVKVETDENLQSIIETVNMDNKLTIKLKDQSHVHKSTKMNMYITIKNLKNIDINGLSNVSTTSNLTLESMDLNLLGAGKTSLEMNCKILSVDISGVGSFTLKGFADNAFMTTSGVGQVKAFDFVVKKLNIKTNGIGNAEVRAEDEISITSLGVGNITYTGNAVVIAKNISGIGKVKKV